MYVEGLRQGSSALSSQQREVFVGIIEAEHSNEFFSLSSESTRDWLVRVLRGGS